MLNYRNPLSLLKSTFAELPIDSVGCVVGRCCCCCCCCCLEAATAAAAAVAVVVVVAVAFALAVVVAVAAAVVDAAVGYRQQQLVPTIAIVSIISH